MCIRDRGINDPELVETLCANSADAIDWLDEHGITLHNVSCLLYTSKLGLHAVGTDLIHLVEGDADGIQRVSGKAHALQHPAQDAAVVDVDGEAVEADAQQGTGGHLSLIHI